MPSDPAPTMAIVTRRTRQQNELRELCATGHVARAIDLAFEHFADFGPDAQLVATLTGFLELQSSSPAVRTRLSELVLLDHHLETGSAE
jgi:hypothetical protein